MAAVFALINPAGLKVDPVACRRALRVMDPGDGGPRGDWLAPAEDVFLGQIGGRLDPPADDQAALLMAGDILNLDGDRHQYLASALRERDWRALAALEGGFAALLWDPRENRATLLADALGQKTLHLWTTPQGGLALVSQVKALYALPGFRPEVDLEALPEFFRFGGLCQGRCLWRGVTQLEPGQIVTHRRADGRRESWRYWRPEEQAAPRGKTAGLNALDDLLARQVGLRLQRRACGLLLDAGHGSRLLAAVTARRLGQRPPAFHGRLAGLERDPWPQTQGLAQSLGLAIQSADLTPAADLADRLARLIWASETPPGPDLGLAFFAACGLARANGAATALSGLGVGPVLAGGPAFAAVLRHAILEPTPSGAVNAGLRLLALVPGLERAAAQLRAYSAVSADDAILGSGEIMPPAAILASLGSQAPRLSLSRRKRLLAAWRGHDSLTRAQLHHLATVLPIKLARQDRLARATGLVLRAPLASPTLAVWSLGLPPRLRATPWGRHPVLARYLGAYLDSQLLPAAAPKPSTPPGSWLVEGWARERLAAMTETSSPLSGLVDTILLRSLLQRPGHHSDEVRYLWFMLGFGLWAGMFLQDPARALAQAPGSPWP